jgi:CRP-like cAMP-binding protein
MQDSFVADGNLTRALAARSKPLLSKAGQILFRQGDSPTGIYVLLSGTASLEMKAGQLKVMKFTVAAGSILSLPAIVGNQLYSMTALACHGSELRFVPRREFEDLIQAEPSLHPKVFEILASEVRCARLALSEVLTKLATSQIEN